MEGSNNNSHHGTWCSLFNISFSSLMIGIIIMRIHLSLPTNQPTSSPHIYAHLFDPVIRAIMSPWYKHTHSFSLSPHLSCTPLARSLSCHLIFPSHPQNSINRSFVSLDSNPNLSPPQLQPTLMLSKKGLLYPVHRTISYYTSLSPEFGWDRMHLY